MSEAEIMAPNKGGRPSEFKQEVFDDICEQMAVGKSLRQICDADGMPGRSTVLRWIKADAGRQDQYQLARDACFDWIAEEAIRIADDASGDYFIEDRDGKSIVVPDHARVQRARLQVDTRKWILSKIAPRKYGDKVELLTDAKPESDQTVVTLIRWADAVRVIVYPMLRDDGTLIPQGTPEYDAAIEKAANEAREHGLKETTIGIDLKREEVASTPGSPTSRTQCPET
jgi:Bacteriophage Sf6, terminase small subunit-like